MKGKREYTIFAVGVIAGLIGGYWAFADNSGYTTVPEGQNTVTDQGGDQNGNGALQGAGSLPGAASSTASSAATLGVTNQPAGGNVTVSALDAPSDVWVAIREVDSHGNPGNILGAGLFVSGVATGTVPLLRDTIPGETYDAVLYKDNGDHIFDYNSGSDILLKHRDGSTIIAQFSTFPSSPH